MKCIYCDQEKDENEFTTEHIIPAACGGGGVYDELFLTNRVCKQCNSKCGLFVDGSYIRGMLNINDRAQSALYYFDKEKCSPLPFIYLGIYDQLSMDDSICECWIDFCGNRFYHIHDNYDEKFKTVAGGNIIKSSKNPGAIFAIFSQNVAKYTFWIKTAMNSLRYFFKKEKKYIVTEVRDGSNIVTGEHGNLHFGYDDGPSKEIFDKISAIQDEEHHFKINVSAHSDIRFLSKVALGLGFNIFGEDYLETQYAKDLRSALWSRPSDDIRAKGATKLLSDMPFDLLEEYFPWQGGSTIALLKCGKHLGFVLSLYGKTEGSFLISEDTDILHNHHPEIEDTITIWVPTREFHLGPIPIEQYLAHKTKEILDDDLLALEKQRISIDEILPQKE